MKNFKELIQRVVLALFRKMACHTQLSMCIIERTNIHGNQNLQILIKHLRTYPSLRSRF